MTSEIEVLEKTEILFALEGHPKHFSAEIGRKTTVSEFALIAASKGQFEEILEVSIEDADGPLHGDLILIEHLSARFAPLHVAKPGLIKTTVHYNGRQTHREFRPNATIGRVTVWAVGPHGLNLEGLPADYQLKYDGNVLSPDQHLGQIAHGKKAVELELVFKVKPQG